MAGDRTRTPPILLRRRAVVAVEPGHERIDGAALDALDLELAALGYVTSARLRKQLADGVDMKPAEFRRQLLERLAAITGADRTYRPQFRRFPDGIPEDTHELWVRRVLVHFYQQPDQGCLYCLRVDTTHVLEPCQHVVCDRCFDGASYSACPVCGYHVEPGSPFFAEPPERGLPVETVRFKVLDVTTDLDAAARELFAALCRRTQALSQVDRTDLEELVLDYGERVLGWLPPTIPVKENRAIVFGTILRLGDPVAVLDAAGSRLQTATDVLRTLAVWSGADPGLQAEAVYKQVHVEDRGWRSAVLGLLGRDPGPQYWPAVEAVKVRRFKMKRMSRRFRRALLAHLATFDPEQLTEDMLRHRSYWVWVGQLLHPHDYASRFPDVAAAFAIVRGRAPSGEPAPRFQTFAGRVEAAIRDGDVVAATEQLRQRPGELGRRLDQCLRLATGDAAATESTMTAFEAVVDSLPTPMLVTLLTHFRGRTTPAPVRIYWPKGGTAGAISGPDTRAPLQPSVVDRIASGVEAVLLARFERLREAPRWLIDRAMADVIVPFNERTSSPSAIVLPRGSTIDAAVAPEKTLRLFLHWCQPRVGGSTDLDLSVGLYGADWSYRGVCSYYQLTAFIGGRKVAMSSGDLLDAPHPDGASEFVDIDQEAAREHGVRYAVMVVNAYSGLAFAQLERAFAGFMARGDIGGVHFDPRTVEMKFELLGQRGIYVPIVFDLAEGRMHWLDAYSRGEPAMNNVESSNREIQRMCPELIDYYRGGARASVYELALLHAAARAREVVVRDGGLLRFERAADESAAGFLARLRDGDGEPLAELDVDGPLTAILLRGDVELPPDSPRYVVFPGAVSSTMAPSDLLSAAASPPSPTTASS